MPAPSSTAGRGRTSGWVCAARVSHTCSYNASTYKVNRPDEMIPAIAAPRALQAMQDSCSPIHRTALAHLHHLPKALLVLLLAHLLPTSPRHIRVNQASTPPQSITHEQINLRVLFDPSPCRYLYTQRGDHCPGPDSNPKKGLPNTGPSLPRTAPPRAAAQHRTNGPRLTSRKHALLDTKNETNARTNL
jgi:hypothetical protein